MKKNLFSTMLALLTIVAMLVSVGCKNYDDDISDINKKLSSVEGTLSTISGQVTTLQSTVSSLQSTVDALKAEVAKCAKPEDVAKMQSQIDALNAAIKTVNEAIAANTKAIEQNGKDIKEGAAYAAATYATIDALAEANAAIAAVQSEVAEVKAAAAKVAEAIADIQSQIEAIKAALENYYTKEQIDAKLAEIISGSGIASISAVSKITAGYGQFNGVFDSKTGKKANWDGPRAAEVAALEKGTWLSTFDVDYLTVQVNPVSADLTNASFDIQDVDGVSAPVIFGTPVPYEATKAASGYWFVPFVADPDAIEGFKAYTKNFTEPYGGSVVVNESVRSDYDASLFTAVISEKSTPASHFYLANESIQVSEMTGEFKIKPKEAGYVYDQYITQILEINGMTRGTNAKKFVADSIQYGLKVQGDAIVYNKEAVAAQMKKQKFDFDIKVLGSTLSLAGIVYTGTYANFSIKHDAKPDDPKPETKEYDAINDTPTPHTMIPAKGEPYQNISMANALKAFGLDDKSSDAYKLFAAAKYHPSFDKSSSYYFTDDDKVTQVVSGLVYSMRDEWDKDNLNVEFKTDYGYDGENKALMVEGHTVYTDVTFKPENKQYSSVVYVVKNIPVSFTLSDLTKYFAWDEIKMYVGGSIAKTANDTWNQSLAGKLKVYNPATGKMDKAATVSYVYKEDDDLFTQTYVNNAVNKGYAFFGAPEWSYAGAVALIQTEKGKVTGMKFDNTTQKDQFTAGAVLRVYKDSTCNYTVTGLQSKIIGRIVSVPATVNVVSTTVKEGTSIVMTSPFTLSKVGNPNNFWTASNVNFKPASGTFETSFTMFDAQGYELAPWCTAWGAEKVLNGTGYIKFAYKKNDSGEWDYAGFTGNEPKVSMVLYDIKDSSDKAYGIRVLVDGDLKVDASSIHVMITFDDSDLTYIKSKTTYSTSDHKAPVEFDVTLY